MEKLDLRAFQSRCARTVSNVVIQIKLNGRYKLSNSESTMGSICHAGQEIPESSDALFSCVWVSVFSFLFASSFKLVFRDPRRV